MSDPQLTSAANSQESTSEKESHRKKSKLNDVKSSSGSRRDKKAHSKTSSSSSSLKEHGNSNVSNSSGRLRVNDELKDMKHKSKEQDSLALSDPTENSLRMLVDV